DNTIEVIKNQSIPVSLVKLGKNCGKGKAVREGMLKAKGDWSLFMDADGSTSIQELEKFIPLIKQQKDIIIGTRKIKGSEIIEHQPFLREFFGKGFTWLSNIIVHAHVSDFTCGFKCFSKKATEVIFSKAVIDDWSFDAEILFIAQKLGYEIIEIPVKWKNDRSSKVRLIHDILNSLKGLFRIRLNAIKGIYG
ncbi:MAG: glycosyltransferase, partial [Candidatus Omnitrophota bacterium]|nr:glycosyltransferase [Candidatus Omnitrophota bacterium]